MALDLENDGDGGEDNGLGPISDREVERAAFQLTFLNLGRTAAQLRKTLLGGQAATRLPHLLLDWLQQARMYTDPEIFEGVLGQVRRVVLGPEISPAEAAYMLRLCMNRLYRNVRSRVDFPLPPLDWNLKESRDEELILKGETRRGFLREMLLALLLAIRVIRAAKDDKNEGP
jgi:hypothetical protein